jgi:hypothetical protein
MVLFSLIDERISICLNVMELCILFVRDRENRVKQVNFKKEKIFKKRILFLFKMALFLAKLCEENPKCLQAFLFDENLLVDSRLLLINELIWKKFNVKFISIGDIDEIFRRIEVRKISLINRKIKMLVFCLQIALTPPNVCI